MNRTRATRPISGSWRAENTDRGQSLVRLTNDDRVKSAPAWSPDGRFIAFLTAEDGVYGSPQLAVMPAAGGEPRILTAELDRWINSFKYSQDGEWLYFLFENDGGGPPCARASARRPAGAAARRASCTSRPSTSRRSGVVAARIENANDAPELYVLGKPRPRRLTDVNDAYLRSVALGDKREGRVPQPGWHAGRGVRNDSRRVSIPSADIRRSCTSTAGRSAASPTATPSSAQYLAANGYVVVEPNPRGSTGRDQAFIRAIYQTWGITRLRRPHRRRRPRHRARLRRSANGSACSAIPTAAT